MATNNQYLRRPGGIRSPFEAFEGLGPAGRMEYGNLPGQMGPALPGGSSAPYEGQDIGQFGWQPPTGMSGSDVWKAMPQTPWQWPQATQPTAPTPQPVSSPVSVPQQGGPGGGQPGFTAGPAGTAGGLTSGPPNQYYGTGPGQMGPVSPNQQTGMPQAQIGGQYGYGQGPGQSDRGYYEQQTPLGSFAAADYRGAGSAAQASNSGQTNPQYASNQYIGATSRGVGSPDSTLQYGRDAAASANQPNPYLGRTTQQASAGRNSMFGQSNRYLDDIIANSTREATTAYDESVNPQLLALDLGSGSFGNTGVQAARERSQRGLGRQLGDIATSARMRDFETQQQLAENQANRDQAASLANSEFNSRDLGRDMSGFLQGQDLRLRGQQTQLGAAQFDSGQRFAGDQFNSTLGYNDLGRNSALAQQLGITNAGFGNTARMFDIGQNNNINQFNAGQSNNMRMFDAGQNNNINQFNATAGNNFLNRADNRDRWNQEMDLGVDNTNWNRMRTGQQDAINWLGQLYNYGQGGINNSTNVQNTPLNYQQQLAQIAQGLGGMGGSNSQNMQGNPYLGFLGGLGVGGQIYNNWGR